jgi:activator of HSP90 ATPase
MRSVIQQTVVLPASAEALFDMYLDPAAHGAWSGGEVEIQAEPGAEFRAFDGALWGQVLEIVRPRLIVQSWRSQAFHASDPDSTLILCFTDEDSEGRIDLVHIDVPDHDYDDVVEGWQKYYWTPWREYLEMKK